MADKKRPPLVAYENRKFLNQRAAQHRQHLGVHRRLTETDQLQARLTEFRLAAALRTDGTEGAGKIAQADGRLAVGHPGSDHARAIGVVISGRSTRTSPRSSNRRKELRKRFSPAVSSAASVSSVGVITSP